MPDLKEHLLENALTEESLAHLIEHAEEVRYSDSPLPTPEDLAKYEAISPHMAQTFMELYKESHLKQEERLLLQEKAKIKRHFMALMCAFCLAILAGFTSNHALTQGDTALSLTFAGASLSTLVATFLKATKD